MSGEHDTYVKASSTHTFLWPFTFESDFFSFDKENPQKTPARKWHYDDVPKSETSERFLDAYMVAQYFNAQARKIFTDVGSAEEKNKAWDKKPKIPSCLRFFYDESDVTKMSYLIKNTDITYELKLHSVRLFLFVPFSIGILAIDAMNDNQAYKLSDIKLINDQGRRIRLPFIPRKNGAVDDDGFIMCAENLGVVLRENGQDVERWVQDFRADIKNIDPRNSQELFAPASFIYGFLSGQIGTGNQKRLYSMDGVTPASDDRMFLVSMIKDENLSDSGKRINILLEKKRATKSLERDDIYSVVFADPNDPSCVDPAMQSEILRKVIYRRWSDVGTLYATTNLSCMCLTSPSAPLDIVCRPFLTEYTAMVILVLAQRVSIEKFAQEAADVVRGAEQKGTLDDEQITEMMELHERYVTWQNQINLFEITDQEQGVEMYALMRKQMGVEGRVKALAGQLDDMYAIANVDQNTNTNDIVAWFAIIAIFMNLASFVLELTETGKQIFVPEEEIPTGLAEFFGLINSGATVETKYAATANLMALLQGLSILIAVLAIVYLCWVKFLKKLLMKLFK
ncbi:MAG: hypothetical protein K6E38_04705 [Fretibacterium sp.]|nr:hypothetical protein [Fretibacterium sp.]